MSHAGLLEMRGRYRNTSRTNHEITTKSVGIASLCLLAASTGHAQQDPKDGKAIPVQQESKPVSQDEWQFSLTPYTFLPSVDLQFNVPP